MRVRAFLVAAAATIATLLGATPAVAQDPAGCVGNRFQLDIFKDRTYVRDGETINYFVSARNDAPNGCTVSQASVRLQLPAAERRRGQRLPGADPGRHVRRTHAPDRLRSVRLYGKLRANASGSLHGARVDCGRQTSRHSTAVLACSTSTGRFRRSRSSPSLTIDKVGSTTGRPRSADRHLHVRGPQHDEGRDRSPGPKEPGVDMSNVTPTDDRCGPDVRLGRRQRRRQAPTDRDLDVHVHDPTSRTAGVVHEHRDGVRRPCPRRKPEARVLAAGHVDRHRSPRRRRSRSSRRTPYSSSARCRRRAG